MKKTVNLILLVCCIVLSYLLGYYNGQNKGAGETQIDVAVVQKQLSELNELATAQYSYTNLATYENHAEFYGYKVPFTTKKFIITYDGVIKAGVDLSKADITVSPTEIVVKLPKAEMLSHEIDYSSLQILDETYSIFNRFEISDYNQFSLDQSEAMEAKAAESDLYQIATSNAEKLITEYFSNLTARPVVFK